MGIGTQQIEERKARSDIYRAAMPSCGFSSASCAKAQLSPQCQVPRLSRLHSVMCIAGCEQGMHV